MAYAQAGSYAGAARGLAAAGVPGPHAKWSKGQRERRQNSGKAAPIWSANTVRHIILRGRPELAQKGRKTRERKTTPRLFRGLLRHVCGSLMTPHQGTQCKSGAGASVGYYWGRCKVEPERRRSGHPFMVSERKLRPWIEAEADRLVGGLGDHGMRPVTWWRRRTAPGGGSPIESGPPPTDLPP